MHHVINKTEQCFSVISLQRILILNITRVCINNCKNIQILVLQRYKMWVFYLAAETTGWKIFPDEASFHRTTLKMISSLCSLLYVVLHCRSVAWGPAALPFAATVRPWHPNDSNLRKLSCWALTSSHRDLRCRTIHFAIKVFFLRSICASISWRSAKIGNLNLILFYRFFQLVF